MRYLERDLWDVETSKIHIGAVKTKRYCSSFVEKSNNLKDQGLFFIEPGVYVVQIQTASGLQWKKI